MTSVRDKLRSKALASKARKRHSFEYNGETYELAACTVKERMDIISKCKVNGVLDEMKFTILMLIATVVEPGTDNKILEESDAELFLEGYDLDFANAAGEAISKLFATDEKK